MNIKQLKKEIIKAVDIEIDTAGSVGINDNNYYLQLITILIIMSF